MINTNQIVDLQGNPITSGSMSAYNGAGSGFGGQLQSWQTHSQSADAALLPDFDQGNARAADLLTL